MSSPKSTPDSFSAGDFGSTLFRRLLTSLALRDSEEAKSLLDSALDFKLVAHGVRSAAAERLPEILEESSHGGETRFEYHNVILALRALDRLGIERDAHLNLLLSSRAYAAGDRDTAEDVAREVLCNEVGKIEAKTKVRCHDILGRILSDRGDFAAAAKHFAAGAKAAHSAKLDYDEWDQYTNRIWCLESMGERLKAVKAISAAERVARRMNSPDALAKTLIDKGNTETALGNLDEARFAYEGALEAAEKANNLARQSDALGNLGNVAYQQSDLAGAERFHRRALAISRQLPDQFSAQTDLNNLAEVLWTEERSEEAVQLLGEALEIARLRRDERSIEQYSRSLRRMNQVLGKYENSQREGAATVPGSKAVCAPVSKPDYSLEKQVRELLNQNKRDETRLFLEQHLRKDPRDCAALCLYGTVLVLCNDVAGARVQFERAIELCPDSLDAHYRVVDLCTKTGELDTLLPRYENAVADDPYEAAVRAALALIYVRKERFDEGIQHAIEAVRLAPEDELVVRILAEAQLMKAHSLLESNWDGAFQVFQDCLATMDRLTHLDTEQKGQWLTFAGRSLEEFAMHSQQVNPPLMGGGMDTTELYILAHAMRYYEQAEKSDPLRKTEGQRARIGETMRFLGQPRELAVVGGQLRADGYLEGALFLLILSLQRDPEQAEANHQLAHVMFDLGGKGSRSSALEYVQRAIEAEPTNRTYREAKLFFERAPEPEPGNRKTE